jgi:NADH-quinone oxidoreductase subunit J
MNIIFYSAALIAIVSTVLAISQLHAIHALLYLIVSFLSVALVFFVLGAPFLAALEVIIYAGAIMVLFVFAVMLLNLGPQAAQQERAWLPPSAWIGPAVLTLVLLAELAYVLFVEGSRVSAARPVGPEEVSVMLFGPYLLGVQMAALLLLAGLVGAYHLGRRAPRLRASQSHHEEG